MTLSKFESVIFLFAQKNEDYFFTKCLRFTVPFIILLLYYFFLILFYAFYPFFTIPYLPFPIVIGRIIQYPALGIKPRTVTGTIPGMFLGIPL